ncbi:MAG: hypothetical protein SH819_05560 [Cytophagales bacterium]|nr:hypothetical protein [Cytophagales bacterium]
MKGILIITLFIAGIGTSVGQEAGKPCPASGAVVIDGASDEWPMAWVDDDDKIFSYNVCADDNNLYVRVKTSDYYAKRKIAAFGFTMWMDATGRKKKRVGLRFPVGGTEAEERAAAIRDEGPQGNSMGEKADYQKMIDRRLIADLEIMELIGLSDEPITSTRSGITNGIKVAIAMDASGAYVYEALIPFRSYRFSRATLSEMSIGFETGKYVVPKATTKTKGGSMIDYTNPSQMSRMQGYDGMIGNPKLTYSMYAWTVLKLK